MKKENDEWIDLFRSRLGESEMQVRKGFWEELERDIPVVISRRRQLIFRFTAAASVLLVLAGASAALWYFSPREEIANAFTQVAVTTGTSGKINTDNVHQDFPVVQTSSTSPDPSSVKPVTAIEDYIDEEELSISISMSFSFSASPSSEPGRNDRIRVEHNGNNLLAGTYDDAQKQTASDNTEDAVAEPAPKEKQKKWNVGVHASTGLVSDKKQTQNMKPFVSDEITKQFSSGTVKHKIPLSAGVSVGRQLSDHWGIESGLTYTQLNAEITAGEGVYYNQRQKLHYIGIPLKADYRLYKTDRMNLYASAGGMIEKCVSGRVNTDYYENGQKTHASRHSIKDNRLQLSLSAALRLQYRISDGFSVYAEPGLSYHFDDGSSVASIRTEKPLNINLLCGVRMTY